MAQACYFLLGGFLVSFDAERERVSGREREKGMVREREREGLLWNPLPSSCFYFLKLLFFCHIGGVLVL